MDDTILNLYKDPSRGLTNAEDIHRKLKDGNHNIPLKEVRRVLAEYENYSLVHRKTKPDEHLITKVSGVFEQLQADLAFVRYHANSNKLSEYKAGAVQTRENNKRVVVPPPQTFSDEEEEEEEQVIQELSSSNDTDSTHYLFTCIDVLSRYAWVIPLHDKTPNGILNCFKTVFQDILDFKYPLPERVQVDRGTEFYNATIKSFMQRIRIQMYC